MVRGFSLSAGQPPNPMLFSGPIECRIRDASLYVHTDVMHVYMDVQAHHSIHTVTLYD